jgi:hypothetical protein
MDGEVDIDTALQDDQMMNGYDQGILVKLITFFQAVFDNCKNAKLAVISF